MDYDYGEPGGQIDVQERTARERDITIEVAAHNALFATSAMIRAKALNIAIATVAREGRGVVTLEDLKNGFRQAVKLI